MTGLDNEQMNDLEINSRWRPGTFQALRWLCRMSLCLLVAMPGLAQTTNPPSLGMATVGNQTVLYWPASATNFVLQRVGSLASTNWLTVTNGIPLTGVVLSNSTPPGFFRLYQPQPNPPGMTQVPGGGFTMGDGLDGMSDALPTAVTVSAFYMDAGLVSYAQWQSIYTWGVNHGYGFVNSGSGKGTNHPVQNVDWYDAVKWCNARSQLTGLAPVYYTDAGLKMVYTNGEADPYVNWMAKGYRLPTEAEWEKAARGGMNNQRFPWGNQISQSLANYYGAPASLSYDLGPSGENVAFSAGGPPQTSPVGYFPANGYGLNDMAGNLSEWCWDWYGTPYAGGTDPHGPATGTDRVLRGGDWFHDARTTRCAARNYDPPGFATGVAGFRCVRGM